ncbi:MAG: Crp/Fnr family transcriptional regulator [Salinivirgaceae bacterium]|nr:Crp/Fnr family transcriptional regulator [Bacteroidales bacterium]MBR4620994.1 Crp/Fnr family transcriptional regulator [Salinivirgaceae bacterium]
MHEINLISEWSKLLTAEQMDMVQANSVALNYNKAEMICKQGAFASNVYFVEKGLMKAYKEYKNGNLIMRFVKPGEIVGLSSLYNKGVYLYSVASVGASGVMSVTADVVKQLIRANSDFAEMVIGKLNQVTVDEHERVISLTQKQLNGRIADAVLHFANNVYNADEFNLQLTRRDVADFCGMSTESAIRILKELHNDKIIKIDGKNLKIISKQLLQNVSEFG